MLSFPEDRRVPAPDLSRDGRGPQRRTAPASVRAIVHPAARLLAPAPALPRPAYPPAAPRPPRSLRFASAVPPPGTPRPTRADNAVRAIVYPAARAASFAAASRPRPAPAAPRAPRRLSFPPERMRPPPPPR